ncbi:hypothetical protein [Mucilaginibacter aquariorum]|uniref:Uncharacterized protein n=1 Tax=Mucilaginibacter aquariorum TaxID=2967225 RepID=A0ABT1SVZ9_9SPHI|nr:hypothetical protein [Mucilaginibacter aquariorum]MCQ6956507.1 hypothetical protein [Mucilaginibacter aquariorum]
MELNEKGYYFTILLFGLFAVQKTSETERRPCRYGPLLIDYLRA